MFRPSEPPMKFQPRTSSTYPLRSSSTRFPAISRGFVQRFARMSGCAVSTPMSTTATVTGRGCFPARSSRSARSALIPAIWSSEASRRCQFCGGSLSVERAMVLEGGGVAGPGVPADAVGVVPADAQAESRSATKASGANLIGFGSGRGVYPAACGSGAQESADLAGIVPPGAVFTKSGAHLREHEWTREFEPWRSEPSGRRDHHTSRDLEADPVLHPGEGVADRARIGAESTLGEGVAAD